MTERPVDITIDMLYNVYMTQVESRKLTAVRIKPSAMHLARIGAVTAKQTLGQWLEEAIREKIEREKGDSNVTPTNS